MFHWFGRGVRGVCVDFVVSLIAALVGVLCLYVGVVGVIM